VTRDRTTQIRRNLLAILDAASDLVHEVGIPASGDALIAAGRVQQLAFTECIRRAGEAVAQIDAIDDNWLNTNLPGIAWGAMKSTRNRLTHNYWTVDYQILHDIAVSHLPAVTSRIAAFLDEPDPYR
jgi:uncharacterized protein with HEPN domain